MRGPQSPLVACSGLNKEPQAEEGVRHTGKRPSRTSALLLGRVALGESFTLYEPQPLNDGRTIIQSVKISEKV